MPVVTASEVVPGLAGRQPRGGRVQQQLVPANPPQTPQPPGPPGFGGVGGGVGSFGDFGVGEALDRRQRQLALNEEMRTRREARTDAQANRLDTQAREVVGEQARAGDEVRQALNEIGQKALTGIVVDPIAREQAALAAERFDRDQNAIANFGRKQLGARAAFDTTGDLHSFQESTRANTEEAFASLHRQTPPMNPDGTANLDVTTNVLGARAALDVFFAVGDGVTKAQADLQEVTQRFAQREAKNEEQQKDMVGVFLRLLDREDATVAARGRELAGDMATVLNARPLNPDASPMQTIQRVLSEMGLFAAAEAIPMMVDGAVLFEGNGPSMAAAAETLFFLHTIAEGLETGGMTPVGLQRLRVLRTHLGEAAQLLTATNPVQGQLTEQIVMDVIRPVAGGIRDLERDFGPFDPDTRFSMFQGLYAKQLRDGPLAESFRAADEVLKRATPKIMAALANRRGTRQRLDRPPNQGPPPPPPGLPPSPQQVPQQVPQPGPQPGPPSPGPGDLSGVFPRSRGLTGR